MGFSFAYASCQRLAEPHDPSAASSAAGVLAGAAEAAVNLVVFPESPTPSEA